jgi:hypothetical protein
VFPHVPKPPLDYYRILYEAYMDPVKEEDKQKAVKYHPLKFDISKALPSAAPPILAREYMYDSLYNKTYPIRKKSGREVERESCIQIINYSTKIWLLFFKRRNNQSRL